MDKFQTGAVVERFVAIASRIGPHIAVVDGPERITYSKLLEAAQDIAAEIPSDAGPLVGIRTERGWRAIASMVGVLLAGRAYVPIDPSYPEERQRYIESDAKLSHIVTDDGVLSVDRDQITSHDVPVDAMYVIYTSGTTGEPKGVVVCHGNLTSLMDAADAVLPFGDGLRWSVFHSLSFDFSVWEIWGALLTAGCAVLVDRQTAVDPKLTGDLLVRERINVLSMVPSAFAGLVRDATRSERTFPDLIGVVFGGEPVRSADVERWWSHGLGPDSALINMYGITETTVHVTYCLLTPELMASCSPGRTPIGQPLPNAEVRISVDGGTETRLANEPGEMIVSGGGVAAGYLGRPTLTTERFPTFETGRSYRSGDCAILNDEGMLFFVGRVDDQVKIRGYRIELGEVESMLARHPNVTAAACFIQRAQGREDRLLAAVVVDGTEADPRSIRQWLTTQVPGYLIPTRISMVDELPVTANGKIDRPALVAAHAVELGSTTSTP